MSPSVDPVLPNGEKDQIATSGNMHIPDGKSPDVKVPNIIEQLDMNFMEVNWPSINQLALFRKLTMP
jgi:hypothetical protein